MKRFASLVTMLAIILCLLPAARAAEPELLSRRAEDIYIYRYPGGDGMGLIHEDGTILTEPVYDEIKDFSEGYVQVSQGEKWGLVDQTGKVCVPLEYEYVGPASQGICYAVREGKYGYLSAVDGAPVTDFIYDYALDFQDIGRVERYVPDGEGNVYSHMGAVNREGKLVVPMEYDYVYLSPNGDAYIVQKYTRPISELSLYGAYDLQGDLLYPCDFTMEKRLLAAIANGGDRPTLAETSSQAVGLRVDWYPEADYLTRIYGSDRMVLVKDGYAALYGLDGTKYTDFVFEAIGERRSDGEFVAAKNGRWGVIDSFGNALTEFFWETQEEARDGVEARFISKWADGSAPYALADKKGKLLTDYKYWSYGKFQQGLAPVSDGKAYGFVDAAGREVVSCKYDIVEPFEEDGFAIVYTYADRHYNAVDTTGRELWAEGASKIWRAGHGVWGQCRGSAVSFWNDQGERLTSEPYYYRTDPKGIMWGNKFDNNGFAVVCLEDGTTTCIDTQGNQVEEPVNWDFNERGSDLHEGLIWAPREGLELSGQLELEKGWGFKNEAGELVVPYLYDAVGYFDHGYASVRLDGIYGMLENPCRVSGWAADEVAAAAEGGYVTPRCSTYQTHAITRLQFAELAVNYLEKATDVPVEPAPADTFTDTADEAALKACAAGIAQGVGEGLFDPQGLLTREQLATMLWRAMERAGTTAEPADLSAYTDRARVSDWAMEGVASLAGLKIMEGTGANTLAPKDSCTVEQAILLVYRAVK